MDVDFIGKKVIGNRPQHMQTATPSLYPQGFFHDKPCRRCSTVFSPKAPSHLYCSEECRQKVQVEKYYLSTYGISLEQWQAMYAEQGGMCALCRTEGFIMKETHLAKLMVDHCHNTGRVRGLLCHNCNRALGLLHDDTATLLRAIEYLGKAVSN